MSPTRILTLVMPVLMLANAACTPLAEGVQKTGDASKQVIADTKKSWRGLFTYNPPSKTPLLPQTRYCYGTQSDIVCYDSPQPHMTAKLVGYQDGTNISWVQPGGGSLGVSGGEPTAQPSYASPVAANDAYAPQNVATMETFGGSVDTSPPPAISSSDTTPAKRSDCKGTARDPFYCKESPYVKPAK